MITNAIIDLKAQGTPDSDNVDAMLKRYPKAVIRDLKVDQGLLSEADALIAYLQRLGTQVDFSLYDDKANIR